MFHIDSLEILYQEKEVRELFKRNTDVENNSVSSSTSSSAASKSTSYVDSLLDSYGCVICSSTPSCPQCGTNEQCSMTSQTCDNCPTTFCETIVDPVSSTKNLSSAQVGGIAGGISGFIFLVVLLGLFYFFKRYRKNLDADYGFGISEEMKGFSGFDDDITDDPSQQRGYNSRNEQKRMSTHSLSTMTNSVFTKASNVLNIAYVPGVTSRPTKPPPFTSRRSRKPKSVYSKTNSILSKETYFSDLENASFYGGKVATKGGNPTLINIKHDEYDYDNDEGEYEDYEMVSQYGFDNRYGGKSLKEEEIDSDTESTNIPLNIGFQIPTRRNFNEDIIEENEDLNESLIELEEEDTDENDGNAFHDVNIGIGVSNIVDSSVKNQRTMPTRYAALVEKNVQIKPLANTENPFFSKHSINNIISKPPVNSEAHSFSDSGSDAYSDSDSDEENIEFLLQQSAQNTTTTHVSNDTLDSHNNSNVTMANNRSSSTLRATGIGTDPTTRIGYSAGSMNPFGSD